MSHIRFVVSVCCVLLLHAYALATAPPHRVATVVVHGFSATGAGATGVFGEDIVNDFAQGLAPVINAPLGAADPTASNQVAVTTYYGDTYPAYYTEDDKADLDAVTAEHGGGVPRYAMIVAKFANHVMERSGAVQVNIIGVSFGGLISRYLIENNVEGLAESGKIARWIPVAGVLNGHYGVTYGGPLAEQFFEQIYGEVTIDFHHMHYDWVADNIHPSRFSTDSEYFADIPIHFWQAGDDDLHDKFLTLLSGKSNDGVVLNEDSRLINLPAESRYMDLPPTESFMHATHDELNSHVGIRAGLAAQLFSRKRVRIVLHQVQVLREFDGGSLGEGEYVFGLQVYSPQAETLYSITEPIHDIRAEDNSFRYLSMAPENWFTANLTWFDDMVLSGETELRLETNVEEIDGDLIYSIQEVLGESRTPLENLTTTISVEEDGAYFLQTGDWEAHIQVEVYDYPEYLMPNTSAENWSIYE